MYTKYRRTRVGTVELELGETEGAPLVSKSFSAIFLFLAFILTVSLPEEHLAFPEL